MAVYFIDSSALVKRYVIETGTAFVTDITDPAAGHHMYVARITGVEVIAALEVRPKSGLRLQIAIHPRIAAAPTSRRIKLIRGRGRLLALAAAGNFRFATHFRPDL